MFGYIRPLKGELKVREYEQFKAMYCGLCHMLKKRCGYAARFIINFDFTFLAMVLSSDMQIPCYVYKRCSASPFRKKCTCQATPELALCADSSVILTYWKLRDTVADESFFHSLSSRLALLMLRKAYKKASRARPDFTETVKRQLSELSDLEKAKSDSLDRTANSFALILQAAAGEISGESGRILSQLLYHTGRWVYIIDALNDLSEDIKKDSYNPLRYRFELNDGALSEEDKDYLRTTAHHSAALVASAFELLKSGSWTGILENIIYYGMPWICGQVISGTWRQPKKIHINNEWRAV